MEEEEEEEDPLGGEEEEPPDDSIRNYDKCYHSHALPSDCRG